MWGCRGAIAYEILRCGEHEGGQAAGAAENEVQDGDEGATWLQSVLLESVLLVELRRRDLEARPAAVGKLLRLTA